MNPRTLAISTGATTYDTGRPCSKGHTSKRYASNGQCVQCNIDQAEARKQARIAAKIIHNTAMFSHRQKYEFLIANGDYETVLYCTELLSSANNEIKAHLKAFINTMHGNYHALTRPALLEIIDYTDGKITNGSQFETEGRFVNLNDKWYDAETVLAVLQGKQPHVNPTIQEIVNHEKYSA